MSWARYDDEFPLNKKVAKLRAYGPNGIAAIGLHLLANTYARHNGTGGLIEAHIPELLCGKSGLKLARLLAEVTMFDEHEGGGWTIHDYAEFHDPNDPNPDRSAADRKKELSIKRADAGRRGGLAKSKQSSGNATDLPEANGVAKPWQSSSPDPVPDPVPPSTSETSSHHPHVGEEEMTLEEKVQTVVDMIVSERMGNAQPTNPTAYRRKVAADVIASHGAQIRKTIEDCPWAPRHAIVLWVEHGNGATMDAYQPMADVVEMPQRRLTREQRIAAMEAEGAPKRFIDREGWAL